VSGTVDDFDSIIEPYHQALLEVITGSDPKAYKELISRGDDVTLGNPFGPVVRGWEQCARTVEAASKNYSDGEIEGFDTISKCVTPELAYIVEVERFRAKVGGDDERVPLALRVTSVFRPEDGTWKLVHRHADPITTPRRADSLIQS
jgi:ketosteroid isomerase-like protein